MENWEQINDERVCGRTWPWTGERRATLERLRICDAVAAAVEEEDEDEGEDRHAWLCLPRPDDITRYFKDPQHTPLVYTIGRIHQYTVVRGTVRVTQSNCHVNDGIIKPHINRKLSIHIVAVARPL